VTTLNLHENQGVSSLFLSRHAAAAKITLE
jgi:hypothetical protein